jgi:hypothetical protein
MAVLGKPHPAPKSKTKKKLASVKVLVLSFVHHVCDTLPEAVVPFAGAR